MRTVNPNLNHGWLDESYLRAFGFAHMGDNVRIHRTVVLPTAGSISIGNNVEIGPYVVLWGKNIAIGDNVTVGPMCVLDGEHVEIPSDTIVISGSGLGGGDHSRIGMLPEPKRKKA